MIAFYASRALAWLSWLLAQPAAVFDTIVRVFSDDWTRDFGHDDPTALFV